MGKAYAKFFDLILGSQKEKFHNQTFLDYCYKTDRKPIQIQSKTMLLFKRNTLKFEFDRHLEHRANYHRIQNGLPVSLVGMSLDFQDLNGSMGKCLQSLSFYISSTGNTKFRIYLNRI